MKKCPTSVVVAITLLDDGIVDGNDLGLMLSSWTL